MLQKELNSLLKNKCCYIGHISPTKRGDAVITLAEKFFDRRNIVPGFGDLMVIGDRSAQKRMLFLHRQNSCKFGLSFRIYRKFQPDLIWVVDSSRVDTIRSEYPSIPIIYSTSKPARNGIQFIVDSKEQKPLFKGEKLHLLVGDYTTKILLNKFHIERKSPEDLYSTITKNHVRFRNELIRAQVNKIKLVMYVESSKKDFIAKKFPGGPMRLHSGETLGKIVDTIEKRYGMEVVWCGSRESTIKKVMLRLKHEEQIFCKQK